jgi:hypothetical protein
VFNIPRCEEYLGCKDLRRSADISARSGEILYCGSCPPAGYVIDVCNEADVCGGYLTAMGYYTTSLCGADTSKFLHNSITNADVLILACHGTSGDVGLIFKQTGSQTCDTYGDFILLDGVVPPFSPDIQMVNINDYVWDNCKLAILFSCYSAGDPRFGDDPESPDAIGWLLFSKGIKCVIAWQGEVLSTDVIWVEEFLKKCDDGATIAEACTYATSVPNGYDPDISNYWVYGDDTQTLTFNSVRTISARMPIDSRAASETNLSKSGYTADETDEASIVNIIKKYVPEFRQTDYTMRISPSGHDGGVCSAEAGDFCASFNRRAGEFVAAEGYSLLFRGNKAYRLYGSPDVNAVVPERTPPQVTDTDTQNARDAAAAKIRELHGDGAEITESGAMPYWDIRNDAFSILVTLRYRTEELPDNAYDLTYRYHYPIGGTSKAYEGPSPIVSQAPEILSVCNQKLTAKCTEAHHE